MAVKILVVVLIVFPIWTVQGAHILGIFASPAKSHYFLGASLMRALAEHEHNVTVINPFGEKEVPKQGSYRDILLTKLMEDIEKFTLNMFEVGEMGPYVNIPLLAYMGSEISEVTLKSRSVQDLIKSGKKCDAIVIEQFYNDAVKALANRFEGVQIVVSTIGPNFWINPLVANPSPLAYIPDIFLGYPPHMTFFQRLTNMLVYLLNVAVHHLYLFPKHNTISHKHVPNSPDINDVIYNASLVLLNSHLSLNQPVPLVPNMIEIGGYHVKPSKKLPDDLQKFLDCAKDGVIYFSMGSNLKCADMPVEKRDALIKVFSKFKQKVLWKWEEDVLLGQPENVKIGKWLPQQDILAHPNVKLFVTHGGLLSTTEAVYFGIPVLAIPVYADQKLNAQVAVDKGYGLSLDYSKLTDETLLNSLNELLNNPKYASNAKARSKIFHDRPLKPIETALFWVAYVIRHKGASHLRNAGIEVPWYQYFLLDVMVLIAVISLVLVFVLKIVYRCLYSKTKQILKI